MIEIKVELECDYDTGKRIQCLVDGLLERNIGQKYKLLKWARTTLSEVSKEEEFKWALNTLEEYIQCDFFDENDLNKVRELKQKYRIGDKINE